VEEVTVTVFGTAFSHIDTPAGALRNGQPLLLGRPTYPEAADRREGRLA
jgi:hypothetical protein